MRMATLKGVTLAVFSAAALAACTQPSGDVLAANQTQTAQSVQFGTVISARNVTVQGSQAAHAGDPSQLVTGKASASQVRGKMGDITGTELAERSFGPNPKLLNDHDVRNNQQAQDIARARQEANALGYITGGGSCIGNPRLVARLLVLVKGVGKRLSGNYYVTQTIHTIDANGYRTTFSVQRNARNASS